MSETYSPEEAERHLYAEAVRRIRKGLEISQAVAAERVGVTTQAWQRYEAGERKFTRQLLDRLAIGLDCSVEEIEKERARLAGSPTARVVPFVRERVSSFSIPIEGRVRATSNGLQIHEAGASDVSIDIASLLGPNAGALRLADETMLNWAEPDELIIYDRSRPPRRDKGCVVETVAGGLFVKIYERMEHSKLWVKELHPKERSISFSLSEVKGVYLVRLRGD